MTESKKRGHYSRFKQTLFLILGIVIVLYYIVCILFARIGVSWLWIWPLAAAFCFVRAIMLHRSVRVPKWLAICYRVLLAAFAVLFIFVECRIISAMNTVPEQGLDYIITLGATVRDGVPTSPLKLRIDRTVEYMQDNPDTILIASGGQGSNEDMSEAACIAENVINAGIDADRIILEDRSHDTEENIHNSFALIPEGASVGIVTSSFHIYRALRITELQGFRASGVPAVTYFPLGVHYTVREFFGVVQLEVQNFGRHDMQAEAETVSSLPGDNNVAAGESTPDSFNQLILASVSGVEPGGGYYTGYDIREGFAGTAWTGLDAAVDTSGEKPVINLSVARPSFCSSACYLVLLKTLLDWDTQGVISRQAWQNLKPYTLMENDEGYDKTRPYQNDGYGCWGRANANASGFASLIRELGAGESFYIAPKADYSDASEYTEIWTKCRPGDFLKLFWNDGIGRDDSGNTGESGHLVIFLSLTEAYNESGDRDDIISYWSSNGSGFMPEGGYGTGECRTSDIFRAICTRITCPEAFCNAEMIMPYDCDAWLASLDGSTFGTEQELLESIYG